MLDRYIDFINQYLKIEEPQKHLLAVSGGIDSMVMLDLSLAAGLDIAVAHVDHGLRDKSSDLDVQLVRDTCLQYNIRFHLYTFDDTEKSKSNFQEKARNIRYAWWNKLCAEFEYNSILTAHHSSDSIETFFINLSRGTGLNGLTGIPEQNINIYRPLSSFNKEEIFEYANNNSIAYRIDESNNDNKYKRNLIRNVWLPTFRKHDKDIETNINTTIGNLKREKRLLDALVATTIDDYISINKQYTTINVLKLHFDFQEITIDLIYYYLKQYGFTYDNCKKSIQASTGSEFISDDYQLLLDRGTLYLKEKKEIEKVNITIRRYQEIKINNLLIAVAKENNDNSLAINNLAFPFTIRTKQNGDQFKPSGMQGSKKKVKDFLTDIKIDKWSKQETLVIEKSGAIVAVLPYRLAHGFDGVKDDNTIFINISHID